MKTQKTPKILIAIPMLNGVTPEFFTSFLSLQSVGNTKLSVEVGSLTYMARNRLAEKAIDGNFDYVLWLDSDMVIPPDALKRLLADAETGKKYITGLYFKRAFPIAPVVCKDIKWEEDEDTGITNHGAELYMDYPKDRIFRIAGSGMGCCLMKTDLLKEVAVRFKTALFNPLPYLGEDYSFCYRLGQMGVKMWCDSRVKFGHVGTMVYDEEIFLQQIEEDEDID